jgi:hypothetical protein
MKPPSRDDGDDPAVDLAGVALVAAIEPPS